ncbi:MAG TPA: RHS repeat-associated core domain-containing protein [Blastocatellia bacterium]|nr:RHS repeat-associated core domain-containing protein [Blastocatellia bacterium]
MSANAHAANQAPSAAGRHQGTFEVDPSGQATYKIPIEVPPGIAGCQPHLELVYNHRQPNGILGVGWNLAGLSAITRTRATYAVDGFNSAIGYGPNDRFSLDGQRLINIAGDYGQPGTLYYTEMQTWRHIRASASPNGGFTVVTKNGEVWQYGTTADSLILAAGGQEARLWALSSITDLNGNSVEFHYTPSPLLSDGSRGTADAGGYYIDKISYTTHSGSPANRFVQFIYELRPDPIADYIGGYPVMTSYRMTRIVVSLAGDNPVRAYLLGYRTSTATRLSCLETVTEVGSDGVTALPPVTLGWQDIATPGFQIGSPSTLNQQPNQLGVQQMDVSGSGSTDIVQLWFDQNGEMNATTYLATPGPDGPTFVQAADSLLGYFPQAHQLFPADVNGDGRTDLLIAYQGSNGNLKLAVFLSNGSGFDPAPASPLDTGDPWLDGQHLQFFAMDANGDGRTDLVEAYSHSDPDQGELLYFRTYLSSFGDGSNQMFSEAIVSPTSDPARPVTPLAFWAMDVNGDGMMDLVRVWQQGADDNLMASAYLSVSTGLNQVSFAAQVVSALGTFSLADQKAFLPVDVNGNGTQDLLQVWQEPTADGVTLHLRTLLCDAAGGFVAGPDTAFADRTLGTFYPMAFNGGGLIALVNQWISGDDKLMFTVYLASPSGSFWEGPTFNAGDAGSAMQLARFFPGDANGDGKADLLRMSYNENQQATFVPYLSTGLYPDLVTTITNAIGGVITVTYQPLSDATVYTPANDSAFPSSPAHRYPNPLTPTEFPAQAVLRQAIYVVSAYSQTNDTGSNRFAIADEYQMSYGGARLDLMGRGWEGFQTVNRLDRKCGRNTVQTYNQDFPYTGTLASTRTEANGSYATDPRVPKDQRAVLMSVVSSDYHSFSRAQGASGLTPSVVEVLKVASRMESYDYGADHFDYALGETYDYDEYGNQTAHVQLGYVDQQGKPLDQAAVVYRYNRYRNDLLADGWALGYPVYAKVTANAADADITRFLPGDYHLEQKTYMPSTYNLASMGRWDSAHGSYLTIGYEYDDFGNRTAETRPGGFVTRYAYEPLYNTFPMQTTLPTNEQSVSLVTAAGYDPRFGVEVAHLDANHDISITMLDAFGRRALRQGNVPQSAGAVSDPNALTQLVTGTPELCQTFLAAAVVTLEITDYLSDGQGGIYTNVQTLQKFPIDSTRDFAWKRKYVDGLGRERELVTESGQSAGDILILTDYDSDGLVFRQSLPFFSVTPVVSDSPHAILNTYDVLGRPLRQQTPAGPDGNDVSITTWEYGTGGRVTMTSAADSNAAHTQIFTHHFYDGKDKVKQMVVPADGNATTTFEYDPLARLTNATDPATATSPHGISTRITYDSLDRKVTFDNPDQNTSGDPNVRAMTYEHDPLTGLLKRQTDAAGQVMAFDYDQLERVTTKTLGDGRVFHYAYDNPSANGMGRLTQVAVKASDGALESQYDFSYDAYGNVITTTLTVAGEPAAFVTRSNFDPQSRLIGQTLPDGSALTREYSFGQLTSQSLDGAVVAYPLDQYDALGNAWARVCGQGVLPGAGVVTDYTYSPAGQLYGEVVHGSAGEVLNLSYTYDLLGQILEITDRSGPEQSQVFTYLNKRLLTASVPGFDPASYSYDASGNLTTKESVSFTYQSHFPLSGTSAGRVVYAATLDACGRTQTRSTDGQQLRFAYDGLGNLCRVSNAKTGERLREILSDYTGRRLRQIAEDGTQVIYVNSRYEVTRPPQGSPFITKYLSDDRGMVASITSGVVAKIQYFRHDHKGSTTHSFGADGQVASVFAYSGYGEMRLLSGADDFRPKYEQRQWDAEVGLYYFGARYYDPMTGRFLTPDSQLGGPDHLMSDVLNRYAFELNNPINLTDPTGHMAKWVGGLLLGVTLLAAGIAIAATAGAATPLAAMAVGAATGALIGGGISAITYSATHKNNFSWKDYGVQTGVGAGVGAVSGGAFGYLGASTSLSLAAKTLLSAFIFGTTDVAGQFATNYAQGNSLSSGLAEAAMYGVVFGAAGGALGYGAGQLAERALASGAEGAEVEASQDAMNAARGSKPPESTPSLSAKSEQAQRLQEPEVDRPVDNLRKGRVKKVEQIVRGSVHALKKYAPPLSSVSHGMLVAAQALKDPRR